MLIADGKSEAQICAELTISYSTLKSHRTRIIARLGARDMTQAAAVWWWRTTYGTFPGWKGHVQNEDNEKSWGIANTATRGDSNANTGNRVGVHRHLDDPTSFEYSGWPQDFGGDVPGDS